MARKQHDKLNSFFHILGLPSFKIIYNFPGFANQEQILPYNKYIVNFLKKTRLRDLSSELVPLIFLTFFYFSPKFLQVLKMIFDKPKISIIIPVKNAGRTIGTTFEYLNGIQYPPDKMEIIFADGDSTDKTVEIIKRQQMKDSRIKLVQIPRCPAPGFARNKALEIATGEFVLFTDGDCAPKPDWIDQLISPFYMDEKIAAVGGEILTLRTDPENPVESYCEQIKFLSVAGRYYIKDEGYFPGLTNLCPTEVSSFRAPFFATANAAFKKSVLNELGGFWSEPTGEDVDLCLRLALKGARLYFAPKAVVSHMHRLTLESFCRVWYGYGAGHPALVQKLGGKIFEIVFQFLKNSPSLFIPSPFKGLICLGYFQLMHLGGFLFLFFGSLNIFYPRTLLSLTTIISGLLFLWFLEKYFQPCFNLKPKKLFFFWCKIRYLTNWSFIKGALTGLKKYGILYIEPSW
jgi:cellulose synthase/poly-beta-1,6-N-acetylglucosamine synthase-like glycosyltransferase